MYYPKISLVFNNFVLLSFEAIKPLFLLFKISDNFFLIYTRYIGKIFRQVL